MKCSANVTIHEYVDPRLFLSQWIKVLCRARGRHRYCSPCVAAESEERNTSLKCSANGNIHEYVDPHLFRSQWIKVLCRAGGRHRRCSSCVAAECEDTVAPWFQSFISIRRLCWYEPWSRQNCEPMHGSGSKT